MAGPTLRTDIVDVYVFRVIRRPGETAPAVRFLQLHRCAGALSGTWQPVMGHVHEGERSTRTALRELAEETDYAPKHGLLRVWQLESVNTYFLASHESVVLSPCFAALVADDVEPQLNEEHDAHRWVERDAADRAFLWPGQRQALAEIVREFVPVVMGGVSEVEALLRVRLD
ncbi:MAG: NUDIX domain-containing protein [Phycisphaera sp.]|nr:NUDIX domain-containing protein [Phycisphaera sp.]